MIVPIQIRLRAKALGLSVHECKPDGGLVLAKLVGSNYVSVGKRNATLGEIEAELTRQETAPSV